MRGLAASIGLAFTRPTVPTTGCAASNGEEAQRAAFEASLIAITVVKRSDRAVKTFVVLPKRWVVERTLGWINRARRLAKDFEATMESSLAWLLTARAFLILRRLARKCQK